MSPMTATKSAEPMIDQTTGKVWPPTLTGSSSGIPACRASHIPSSAPTKPSAMETRQPPRESPPGAPGVLDAGARRRHRHRDGRTPEQGSQRDDHPGGGSYLPRSWATVPSTPWGIWTSAS